MPHLVNQPSRVVSNDQVGPRLHVLTLESPEIARRIQPGQFVHLKIPDHDDHILRRPFSVYARDVERETIEILYQEVGSLTRRMPELDCGGDAVELIGPVGNTWDARCDRALLVGGGVGAAPLYLLAENLRERGVPFDVVLGAQTKDVLVARQRYADLIGCEPCCATDDGSYGRSGFCTSLVEERLAAGSSIDGVPYDYLAVCGPEPLMKIVSGMGAHAGVRVQVSMEKRMACGIGACLSCVVDTTSGKRRSCVDGPVFDAEEVVWS